MFKASRPLAVVAIAATVGLALAGCSTNREAVEPTESATSTAVVEPSSSASDSATSATPTSTKSESAQRVAEVAKKFSTLAPESLFEKLETCNPNGIENSVECSGPTVGQFQFFASEAKAASTTQLLTELRSSRVVEDKANRIVGWTTLGNNAVVTVVDTDKGQVLQQIISSDRVDPEVRIRELGLKGFHAADSEGSTESTGADSEPTPSSTTGAAATSSTTTRAGAAGGTSEGGARKN